MADEADDDETGGPSILTKIRGEWKKNGSKEPDDATKVALVKAYKISRDAYAKIAAEAALAKADESSKVKALAEAFGGRPLRIDGAVHDFACRKDMVYFRKKNAGEIVDL